MEFLFTAQWASMEALVVILCIGIILSIYAYDAFFFLKQCYVVLFPKKPIRENFTEQNAELENKKDEISEDVNNEIKFHE